MRENVTRWARVACAVAGLASCDGAIALAATTPFSGTPVALPGQIDAEKFDNGGEGIAYHDTTAGNAGGQFRNTDVDIEAASEGGFDVGWAAAGEWLNYTVNVATAGAYTVSLRVASPSGASMHVGFNTGSSVWKVLSVPNTGGWQNWTSVSFTATLGAGTQQMTIFFDTGGMNLRNVIRLLVWRRWRRRAVVVSRVRPSRCQEPSRPQTSTTAAKASGTTTRRRATPAAPIARPTSTSNRPPTADMTSAGSPPASG